MASDSKLLSFIVYPSVLISQSGLLCVPLTLDDSWIDSCVKYPLARQQLAQDLLFNH